jgi:hypothetical protein
MLLEGIGRGRSTPARWDRRTLTECSSDTKSERGVLAALDPTSPMAASCGYPSSSSMGGGGARRLVFMAQRKIKAEG